MTPERWMCRTCRHTNLREDGPVCENCGEDNNPPMCAWCGLPALEQVETQPGAYTTTSDPNTGRTARTCTRLPVMAWACGRHRGLTVDETFGDGAGETAGVEQAELF